jgi:hypothetical protein
MSSIFIQIASYHDLEMLETIKDLLNKCSANNSLHFGVHNCFFEENPYDESFVRSELNKLNKEYKLSIAHSKFPDNIGVGLGRYIANEFYQNEDYYMQIDSHMYFMHKWDEILIGLLEQAKDSGVYKPVISSPNNAYFVNENGQRKIKDKNLLKSFMDTDFDVESLIKKEPLKKIPYQLHDAENKNEVNRVYKDCFQLNIKVEDLYKIFEFIYVNGAFIFGDGSLSSVKPNKNILYFGDEVLHSSRLYTHGYTILRSTISYLCFHLTRSKPGKPGEDWIIDRRREAHEDLPNYNIETLDGEQIFRQLSDKNMMELRKILGLRIKDDQSFGDERDYQEVIDSIL